MEKYSVSVENYSCVMVAGNKTIMVFCMLPANKHFQAWKGCAPDTDEAHSGVENLGPNIRPIQIKIHSV